MVESLDSDHDIIYAVYSLDSSILRDREFVYLENRFSNLGDGKRAVLCFSISLEMMLVLEQVMLEVQISQALLIYVGIMHPSGFVIRPINENSCEVTYRFKSTLQVKQRIPSLTLPGWIPKWLVNFVSGSEPAYLAKDLEI